jgi:hypothetical protein
MAKGLLCEIDEFATFACGESAQSVVRCRLDPRTSPFEVACAACRQFDDVPTTIVRVAASRNRTALLEIVEQFDEVAAVESGDGADVALGGTSVGADGLEHDDVEESQSARAQRRVDGRP